MACTFAMVEIAAGLMPTYAWYAAVLPVLGLTTLLTLTAANASIQLGVEPRLRGRVMALYLTLLLEARRWVPRFWAGWGRPSGPAGR